MRAKIAYLTSPAPNRFVLNFQIPETWILQPDDVIEIEISKGHLANIIITATGFAWTETSVNRVIDPQTESAHEREYRR